MIDGHGVTAVLPLHYGACFLPYAMRSVIDVVDEFLIIYSKTPNHGNRRTPYRNPDTEETLFQSAQAVDHPEIHWYSGDQWASEGAQFDYGMERARGDIVLKLDADELYPPGYLSAAIRYGLEQDVRRVRLGCRHYWRSFYKAFTQDPACPERIFYKAKSSGETTYLTHDTRWRIQHMGYAQPVDLIRYKMSIHGHGAEFRRDVDWFNDIFLPNRQYDCHPIGSDSWMIVEDVVPPDFMLDHPYAKLRVIE